MTITLKQLNIRSREQWRAWLETNSDSCPGVWLVFRKGETKVKSLAYEDSVREALCFGWIDSLIKRLDDRRYARKFTPRKPTSKWSEINRKRWRELNQSGQLAPAGQAASPTHNSYALPPRIPTLPTYIAKALKSELAAWRSFQELAPSYRRHYVAWIHTAKRKDTRDKRICEAVALLKAGKRLGLK